MRWVYDKNGSGGGRDPSAAHTDSEGILRRLSCRAKRSTVETSGPESGVSSIRGQISPLRPSASGRNDNGTAFGLSPSRACVALRRAGRSLVSPVTASEAISQPRNGDGFIAALLARTQASPADGAPGLPQSYRAPPTHTAGNFRIDSESLILNNQGLMSRPKWRNWQTRRIQNPVRFTPGEGSIPSFGTLPRHAG